MEKISVVFIGTGDFGVPILEALLKDTRFVVQSIVTGIDKAKGRGLAESFSAVKQIGIMNKLLIQQPAKIADLKQDFIHQKPDYFLVVAYGEIIPKDILELPKIAPINVHGSLLPKFRGASPIHQAILEGETKTGITWIYMGEKMDAGDIIHQEELPIEESDTFPTLFTRLSNLAAQKTADVLETFKTHPKKIAQDETQATYCKKISKEDGFIDPKNQTAMEIMRRVRAYSVWPGCTLFWNDKKLKVIQATILEQKNSTKINAGEIQISESMEMLVGTRDGILCPTIVQPESKKPMKIQDFLRGYRQK